MTCNTKVCTVLSVQGTEVISKLYAAHQEDGSHNIGFDNEVSTINTLFCFKQCEITSPLVACVTLCPFTLSRLLIMLSM